MNDARTYNFKGMLLAGDLLAFALALGGAAWIRYYWNPGAVFSSAHAPWREMLTALPYALVLWAVTLRFGGLYRLHRSPSDEMVRLGRAVVVTFVILGSVTFFYRGFSYSRAVVLLMMPLVFTGTLLVRTAVRFLWHQVMQLDPVQGSALIVGTGGLAEQLVRGSFSPRSDYQARGVVSVGTEPVEEVGGVPVVGSVDDLSKLLASGRYQAVMVADGRLDHDQHLQVAEACLKDGIQYLVVPDVFELLLDRVRVNLVGGVPLLGLKGSNLTGVNFVLKRIFDVVVSAVLLILASPVMLLTALGIRLSSKGPVFFTQERVGLHGKGFRFIKFRSMHVDAGEDEVREYAQEWIRNATPAETREDGKALYKRPDDPRIFRFGSFIRKYSIDELPQLVNVFKGDMSLIGPRPPVPYEVEAYREWHQRRFEALPGITGLWQVSGRNELSFDEMARLDIEYIENWSFGLDLRIALRTVGEVLSGGGH